MTIAPSAALVLPATLRLTPEQFALVCEANPEAVLELAADGQLIRMTPTGGDTGRRNTRLLTRLQTWAHRQGGWDVFDSSTGFRLADGSVLSPDASMVRLVRWQVLSAEQRRGAAAQAGRLPGQRCPAGLAAVSREAGGGDLATRGGAPAPGERRGAGRRGGAAGAAAGAGGDLSGVIAGPQTWIPASDTASAQRGHVCREGSTPQVLGVRPVP